MNRVTADGQQHRNRPTIAVKRGPVAINSCKKGKAAERNFAAWLREEIDPNARRGFGQSAGGSCRPDVESSLPIHVEVKHVERLAIYDAMDQSIRDCHPNNIPIVAHRKNRTPWHITILASDLIRLSQVISQAVNSLSTPDTGSVDNHE